ncbi:50S ribosomal protein L4 [Candidatus Haliotispira prima]|uniref:Large ribosomal subunit protein uL4 n=1 Tax=Candidatus Haliotispira prima TaxID=3034016 RepID=A0ABY8MFZ7_9SPIO|nr:50S ribosomal protein L4 [Candidatus Haliotispira prima]
MEKKLYSIDGKDVGSIQLADEVFGTEVNKGLIHQLLVMELANKRQGTASTRRRGEVRGSTAKPWRQKGTGRARSGHKRSPIWKGGGVVFGPHPRSYRQAMPKKMKRNAYKSLLSLRVSNDEIVKIVENFQIESGKTKDFAVKLANFATVKKDRVVVILGDNREENTLIRRAGSNIANLTLLDYWRLEVHDFFYAKKILFTESSIKGLNTFYRDNAGIEKAV